MQKTTLTLKTGDILTVNADSLSKGTVVLDGVKTGEPKQSLHTLESNSIERFGPYAEMQRFSIYHNTGLLTYTKTPADFLSINDDCDNGGAKVVVIGSSIYAQGVVRITSRFSFDGCGPLEWAARLSGQRFRHINRAISGKTTTEMLTWLDDYVLALKPDVVVAQNATNEIAEGFDATVATSTELYGKILASGAKLLISPTAMRDQSLSGWTQPQFELAVALNEWKRQYAESHKNATYAEINKYIVDPNSAIGELLPGMTRDGTHWTPAGAFRVGFVLSEKLNTLLPEQDVLNPSPLVADGLNLIYGCESVNPSFAGDGGYTMTGVSGDMPDDWRVERVSSTTTGAAVASVAAVSDLDPRRQVSVAFTPGGLGGTITGATQANPCVLTVVGHGITGSNKDAQIVNIGGMTELEGYQGKVTRLTDDTLELVGVDTRNFDAFTNGGVCGQIEQYYIRTNAATTTLASIDEDFYEHLCDVEASAFDGWADIEFQVDDTGSSKPTYSDLSNIYEYALPNVAWSGVMRSPQYQINGGARLRMLIGINSALPGTPVIKMMNPQLRRINPSSLVRVPTDGLNDWPVQ